MKNLIHRLSRVANSAQYNLVPSDSQRPSRFCFSESFFRSRRAKKAKSTVPQGYVPLYVGDEKERFIVSAKFLNHPVLIGLLNQSAEEYGYEQKGVLQIRCHVMVFERIMESLRLGVPVSTDLIAHHTII